MSTSPWPRTRRELAAARPAHGVPAHRHRGQSLVELALVMPMFFGMVVVLFQWGVLFMTYQSLVHATRDVGRWLAVHPDSTDAEIQAYILSHLPANLAPSSIDFTSSPWTPACAARDAANRCASRVTGAAVRVGLLYDASPHVFLPSGINLPFFRVTVPTTLPRYDYYVMIEPR